MYKCLLIALLISIVQFAESSESGYVGYKIYKAIPQTHLQCNLLHELSKNTDYDFLSLSKLPKYPAIVMVAPAAEINLTTFLYKNKISYKLINADISKTIEEEFNYNRALRKKQPFNGKGRLSTDRYYTHNEINNYIEDLAKRFPRRVFIKTVGRSYEKRWIKTITITNGNGRSNKPVIWVDGAFHAREWLSPATVLYIIDQLVENYNEHADLLQDHDWVILPVVNPDGYDYTHSSKVNRMWRKTRQPWTSKINITCYGTDPNRNFDFHWNEGGSSTNPCSDIFAGPKPFSEPETIVVRDLLRTLKGRGVFYLTVHTYGNYLLYPWGWTEDLPETWKDLDEIAQAGNQAVIAANGTEYLVGSSTNVLYIAAGASDDYAFSEGFPISITIELSGGGITGFDPPAKKIDELVKESWICIRAMAEKVVEKYKVLPERIDSNKFV